MTDIKTLKEGVWHDGPEIKDRVWGWRDSRYALIHFDKKPKPEGSPYEYMGSAADYVLSQCPSCQGLRSRYPGRTVKRWMILPP